MKKNKRGILCIGLGICFLIGAFFLWGENLWDDAQAGKKAAGLLELALEKTVPLSDIQAEQTFQTTISVERPDDHEAKDGILGVLSIPKLELTLPVQAEYDLKKLKTAPCRYRGRFNDLENLVICAHNYSRHFGNLKDLEEGDQISFTYLDTKNVIYEVDEILTIEADNFDEVESQNWDLSLFTCTIGGAKRVLVHCRQVR